MEIYNVVEICAALDIAILSIAYPIILEAISNIGDKYKSEYIPELFNRESFQRRLKLPYKKKKYKITNFQLSIVLSFISLLFIIFQIEPLWGWDNWFINNSAKLVVVFFTLILTVFFFLLLSKVILYRGKPTALIKYIIKKYNSPKQGGGMKKYCLKAINELTYYAIEKQDEHLQETLLYFYAKTFSDIRKKHNKELPLKYPVDLYFMVNRLNEMATFVQNRRLKAIEHRAVSGVWLLGENDEIISEKTYNCLWRNICAICDYPRLVKMFWAHSSQYYERMWLYSVMSTSKKKEDKDEERRRFGEFHYALGGLVYYRKRYDLLKYFFEYTQSSPSKYYLLPESMTEIFDWLEYFENYDEDMDWLEYSENYDEDMDWLEYSENYDEDMDWLEYFENYDEDMDLFIVGKYPFPELDNVGNKEQISESICSYLTILFIRQYSLSRYYMYQKFTDQPDLPEDIEKLSKRLDHILFFKTCLDNVLLNEELLTALGYKELVKEKKDAFNKFIEELTERIKEKIGAQELNAELSKKKISCFYKKSESIITKAFKQYKSFFINLDEEHRKGSLKMAIRGARTLISKSAFTDGGTHLNYNAFFAERIKNAVIKREIPNSFMGATTKRYLLNREDVIAAISKLTGEKSDTTIILRINILQPELKTTIENSIFKDRIKYISSTDFNFKDLLFVLRKEDLPAIERKELTEEEIKDDKLELLNDQFKIYASVIDINREENKEIKDKWRLDNKDENLKIQLALSFLSVIHWKDSREIVEISINSEFEEQGIPNTISDIEPLGKE